MLRNLQLFILIHAVHQIQLSPNTRSHTYLHRSSDHVIVQSVYMQQCMRNSAFSYFNWPEPVCDWAPCAKNPSKCVCLQCRVHALLARWCGLGRDDERILNWSTKLVPSLLLFNSIWLWCGHAWAKNFPFSNLFATSFELKPKAYAY